ncbi:hypothetical protein RJT34_19572 [Clitoria ternatea]|uniref:Uncharacterized protein n=1 Tax=Clitoria ternatea TaxID=43366 RepID=A0AAN9IRF5_CLITE
MNRGRSKWLQSTDMNYKIGNVVGGNGLMAWENLYPSLQFMNQNLGLLALLFHCKATPSITQEHALLDDPARIEDSVARFPMFDWVGEGIDIREMLAGASLMDEANRSTVLRNNTGALLALCWYWATDGVGSEDMVILPYKEVLLFSVDACSS